MRKNVSIIRMKRSSAGLRIRKIIVLSLGIIFCIASCSPVEPRIPTRVPTQGEIAPTLKASPTTTEMASPTATAAPGTSQTPLPSFTIAVQTETPSGIKSETPTPAATLSTTEGVRQVSRTNFPSCEPIPIPFTPILLPTMPTDISGFPNTDGEIPMRDLADAHHLLIGAAAEPVNFLDLQYAWLLANEFNLVAAENAMKWERVHPEPEYFDFTEGDTLVSFAEQNDMAVYGHALVWDLQLPAWVTEDYHSRTEWMEILCTHVKTVVSHYRGRVYAWVVVNEALDENGLLRDTFWLRAIGPDYIAMAFQWAREADPQTVLVYNDFSVEGMGRKAQGMYALLQGLLEQGAAVDAAGLQMHVAVGGPPTAPELAENMARLADLGLDVHISEMDVLTFHLDADPQGKFAAQAEVYRQAMAVCLNNPRCTVVVTWGVTDSYSWIVNYKGLPDAPLLFDEAGERKPAYYALQSLLLGPQNQSDPDSHDFWPR